MAEYLIGRWWAKCEAQKAKYGNHNSRFIDECENFWFGIRALQSLSIACVEAVHFALAMNTNAQRADRYIEKELGFSPICCREEIKKHSFRGVVSFEVEFTF